MATKRIYCCICITCHLLRLLLASVVMADILQTTWDRELNMWPMSYSGEGFSETKHGESQIEIIGLCRVNIHCI